MGLPVKTRFLRTSLFRRNWRRGREERCPARSAAPLLRYTVDAENGILLPSSETGY